MIKAEKIKFEEPTNVQLLSNNLVIEGKIEGLSQYHPFKKNESVNTGYDESKYTIETCGGIYNEGNKGEEEKDPRLPHRNQRQRRVYVCFLRTIGLHTAILT